VPVGAVRAVRAPPPPSTFLGSLRPTLPCLCSEALAARELHSAAERGQSGAGGCHRNRDALAGVPAAQHAGQQERLLHPVASPVVPYFVGLRQPAGLVVDGLVGEPLHLGDKFIVAETGGSRRPDRAALQRRLQEGLGHRAV